MVEWSYKKNEKVHMKGKHLKNNLQKKWGEKPQKPLHSIEMNNIRQYFRTPKCCTVALYGNPSRYLNFSLMKISNKSNEINANSDSIKLSE